MATNAPTPSRQTSLIGTIRPDSLVQQAVRPPQLRAEEFIATLCSGGPGSSSYTIGERVDGLAYDRIVLHHGAPDRPSQRVWERVADRGVEVEYLLVEDTSSTGFVFGGA